MIIEDEKMDSSEIYEIEIKKDKNDENSDETMERTDTVEINEEKMIYIILIKFLYVLFNYLK